MKNIIKSVTIMTIIFALLALIPNIEAKAAEAIQANQLIEILEDTNVMESPDDNSNIVGSFNAGMSVITLEVPENGWVKVMYQDIEGYIKMEVVEADYYDEELAKEFEVIRNDDILEFEVIEYEKSQNRQKLVWGIIIGGLVIALFVVGIITGVDSSKRKKGKRE